jgi:hypothetical protein
MTTTAIMTLNEDGFIARVAILNPYSPTLTSLLCVKAADKKDGPVKGLVPFELNVPIIQKLARKSNVPRLLAAFMNSRSGGEEGRERSSTFFR